MSLLPLLRETISLHNARFSFRLKVILFVLRYTIINKKVFDIIASDGNPQKFESFSCDIAIYSSFDFSIVGRIPRANSFNDFCTYSKSIVYQKIKNNFIGVCVRGNCSFDTKTRNAFRMGYKVK